jgi:NADH-quinone oxidoreductase subunit F
VKGEVIEELLPVHPTTGKRIEKEEELPFFKNQARTLLAANKKIDPIRIYDYIIQDGYSSFISALSKNNPQQIVDTVKVAGLRGRGGAGFPTGKKWEFLSKQPGEKGKYLVCNADEGDPGAYMDRSLLEGNPHSIIEGMLIGALGTGATEGIIYVRAEYPLAIKHLLIALRQAHDLGILGENILNSGFSFDISVVRGAGAFVCGEETALMASIEGRRGMPRSRPPFPAVSGLFGKPTNINNVETWANVPHIIKRGAAWFSSIGTDTSKGTKVFSLVGKVVNTGLVEVPMGITMREIVFDIGGGIPDGKKFKAVQTGGPSGGCIPESLLDTPVDYESLVQAGSIMGSGGMIVMDENNCMVEVARYFVSFTQEESCGKCTPCREGTWHMKNILADITEGRGQEGDIELLEKMGRMIKSTALCGLGNTAPNPVLTTIRYFREEYEAHIRDKRCPAGVCKALIRYVIDPEKCTGCQACFRNCPVTCIAGERKKVHVIDQSRCIKCGMCHSVCNFDAVRIE